MSEVFSCSRIFTDLQEKLGDPSPGAAVSARNRIFLSCFSILHASPMETQEKSSYNKINFCVIIKQTKVYCALRYKYEVHGPVFQIIAT